MPTRFYSLDATISKQVQVSWNRNWRNVKVLFEGQQIGFTISDIKALTTGVNYLLPNGSTLRLRVLKEFGISDLELTLNDRLLPGSMSFPLMRWRNAYGSVFIIGGLAIVFSLLALIPTFSFFQEMGYGWITLVLGSIFLGLGNKVKKRSRLALGFAFAIYLLDSLLWVILVISTGSTVSTGSTSGISLFMVRFIFLYHMWVGFKAIDELKEQESQDNFAPLPYELESKPPVDPIPNYSWPAPPTSVESRSTELEADYLTTFNQAISLAQAGQKAEAYNLLTRLVLNKTNDSNLLLWLAYTAPQADEAYYWLQKSARLDPANPAHIEAKKWFNSSYPSFVASSETPAHPEWSASSNYQPGCSQSSKETISSASYSNESTFAYESRPSSWSDQAPVLHIKQALARFSLNSIGALLAIGMVVIAVLGLIVVGLVVNSQSTLKPSQQSSNPATATMPPVPLALKTWKLPDFPGSTPQPVDKEFQEDLSRLFNNEVKINNLKVFLTSARPSDIHYFYGTESQKVTGMAYGLYFDGANIGFSEGRVIAIILIGQHSDKFQNLAQSNHLISMVYKPRAPVTLAVVIS